MKAVLLGAQHRETSASRVRAVEKKGQSPSRQSRLSSPNRECYGRPEKRHENEKWRRQNLRHFFAEIQVGKRFFYSVNVLAHGLPLAGVPWSGWLDPAFSDMMDLRSSPNVPTGVGFD